MTPFDSILNQFPRLAVAGGPNTGKTTLGRQAAHRRQVIATDAHKELPWEDVPHRVIDDVSGLDTFLVEGVQVPRALRKGMPVDALVFLKDPKTPQTKGQSAMGKGVLTVLKDWVSKTKDLPPTFIRNGEGFSQVPTREYFESL